MELVIVTAVVAVAFLYGVYVGEQSESTRNSMNMKDINKQVYHMKEQSWLRKQAD